MTYAAQQPSLTPDAIALLNAMAGGIRTKDAGTTAGAQVHGPGGLLATQGLNKQVVNAMIMPRGLSGRLPVRPSNDTNEIFAILTGLLTSTGNEPSEACAAWPLVGQFKVVPAAASVRPARSRKPGAQHQVRRAGDQSRRVHRQRAVRQSPIWAIT